MKKVIFLVQTLNSSLDAFLENPKFASFDLFIDVKKKCLTYKRIEESNINSLIDHVSSYFSVINTLIEETHTPFFEAKPEASINLDEVKDDYLSEISSKLYRTTLWAVYHRGINSKKIASHLYTCSNEISLRCTCAKTQDINLGDLVTCYYGIHLPGEINGHNIIGIVCNLRNDDMVYVVPVAKLYNPEIHSLSYLRFSVPEDAKYYENSYESNYEGGIALVDSGKYINAKRIVKKAGRVSYNFFAKLIPTIPTTFNFTDKLKDFTETNWDF